MHVRKQRGRNNVNSRNLCIDFPPFSAYDPNLPCQCNDECGDYGNCCEDYEDLCVNGGGGSSDSSCVDRCVDEGEGLQ